MTEGSGAGFTGDPVGWLRDRAPWLLAPELGCCLVGTQALAIACRRSGLEAPRPHDIDLAWALNVEEGSRLLSEHGVAMASTDGNLARGTLAMKLDGQRLEITTFRAANTTASVHERILSDLNERDMTVGALALQLADGTLHDPCGGVEDYVARRIVAVGDPADRVREHPVRWLRYFRKAWEWGFEVDRGIRKLDLPANILDQVPPDAIASEIRMALLRCPSPGRFFMDLYEVGGLLAHLLPELNYQFDGRPAGPQCWHPEISQALHMILALEWAAQHSTDLNDRDRLALMIAVLGHDIGKGYTRAEDLPGHPGHEQRGRQPLDDMLERLPSLADNRAKTLARAVCELHVMIRHADEHRPGTLARLYERSFRAKDFPVELFALAVASDSGGRLGHQDDGHEVYAKVLANLQWLRSCCEQVDAGALRREHQDLPTFRQALHEARARAIDESRKAKRATTPDAHKQSG